MALSELETVNDALHLYDKGQLDVRGVLKHLSDRGFRIYPTPDAAAGPTDAQVIAALNAYQDRRRLGKTLGDWGSFKVARMRAALRAAFMTVEEG